MLISIVVITVLISVLAFRNHEITDKLSLKPTLVLRKFQLYRIFSHALVHADWAHLIVNMYVLFIFGEITLYHFSIHFGKSGTMLFFLFYALSLLFSSLYTLYKHRNDNYYTAIGASGAVNAVVFSTLLFDPWNNVYFFGVIPIPGIIFGALYLIYSAYMGRKNADNIGHDAHFFGALFGLIFPIIIHFDLLQLFIKNLIAR